MPRNPPQPKQALQPAASPAASPAANPLRKGKSCPPPHVIVQLCQRVWGGLQHRGEVDGAGGGLVQVVKYLGVGV